jgi:hypothetical protein
MNQPGCLSQVPLCVRDTLSTSRAHGVPVGSTSRHHWAPNAEPAEARLWPEQAAQRAGVRPAMETERMTVRIGSFGGAFQGLTGSLQRSRTRRTEHDGRPGASPSRSAILASATII